MIPAGSSVVRDEVEDGDQQQRHRLVEVDAVRGTVGWSSIACGSRASAEHEPVRSGCWSVGRPAWVATIGSLSTYTTRVSGAVSRAISWVLGEVGMPVPMSMICRMPLADHRSRPRRRRKARLARALSRTSWGLDLDDALGGHPVDLVVVPSAEVVVVHPGRVRSAGVDLLGREYPSAQAPGRTVRSPGTSPVRCAPWSHMSCLLMPSSVPSVGTGPQRAGSRPRRPSRPG